MWKELLLSWGLQAQLTRTACSPNAKHRGGSLDHVAGTAIALHFCTQSLIVAGLGTAMVVLLRGDTAWPLIVCCTVMPTLVLLWFARPLTDLDFLAAAGCTHDGLQHTNVAQALLTRRHRRPLVEDGLRVVVHLLRLLTVDLQVEVSAIASLAAHACVRLHRLEVI